MLCANFPGAHTTCLVSLRAFSNLGFRHDLDALREFSGCTYDVPRIPPCVQQPGIPTRSRCSARIFRVHIRRASYPSVRSATWDSDTISMLCANFPGAHTTCLVSLRAFSNLGFRHDRAALRRVNWTSAGTVYTKAFLYLNPAAVVRRGAYLSAHPEQLRKVVCFDLLEPSRSHAPSPVPSPVREEMSIWESWLAA